MKPSVGMRFVSVVMIVILLAPMFSVAIDVSEMIDWSVRNEVEQIASRPISYIQELSQDESLVDQEISIQSSPKMITADQEPTQEITAMPSILPQAGGAGAGGEQEQWWIIDFLCEEDGTNLPSHLEGKFIAPFNTIGNLDSGIEGNQYWSDAILYIPLNVLFGVNPNDVPNQCVWFQFAIQFDAFGVRWSIWDIYGFNTEDDFYNTPIDLDYTPGHEYQYSLTTSNPNVVTFTITDISDGVTWSTSDWSRTIPSIQMIHNETFFSPACAVEGYTSNTEISNLPHFQTRMGTGIQTIYRDGSWEEDIPSGVSSYTRNINSDEWFWGMINDTAIIPRPSIFHVDYPEYLEIGSPATIKVWVANEATYGTATWQTISVSFPENQGVSDILVLAGESFDISQYTTVISPNSGPGWQFYSDSRDYYAENYIIEASTTWSSFDIYCLSLNVTPTSMGEFHFFVKSVASIDNWACSWTPSVEEVEQTFSDYSVVVDDQHEYVRKYTIGVNIMPSSISLSANPSSITKFGYTQLEGLITSSYAGDKTGTVSVYSSDNDGATWKFEGSVSSNANGEYSYTWHPPTTGNYKFKASWDGNPEYSSAISNIVSVSVNEPIMSVLYNVMCTDVNDLAWTYGDEFLSTDEYIYCWFAVEGITPGYHLIQWRWYLPDGVTPFMYTYKFLNILSDHGEFYSSIIPSQHLPVFSQYSEETLYVDVLWDGTVGVILVDSFSVTMIMQESSISTELSSSNIIFGDSVTITSTIDPTIASGDVLYEYSYDQNDWFEIGYASPTSGIAEIEWYPPTADFFYVRSTWSGNFAYYGCTSETVNLNVEPAPTSLHVSLSSSRILLGNSILVTGIIEPQIEGAILYLQVSSDGSTWDDLYDDLTNSNGIIQIDFSETSGTYYFRARWEGDDNYLSAISSEIILTINWKPTIPVLESLDDIVYDSQFDVLWSESLDQDGTITGYLLQISTDSEFSTFDEYFVGALYYQFIDLIPDTYYTRVQAVDNDGQSSDWSNIVQVTVIPPNTPVGSDIICTDISSGVSLSFSDVLTAGQTTITLSTQGAPPDQGYIILMIQGNTYIDITTTAIFSGPLTIAIPYDLSGFNENNPPKLRHIYEDGTRDWIENLVFDFENNMIYGEMDTLSTFILEIDITPPETTITLDGTLGDNDWYISDILITLDFYEQASLPVTTTYSYDNITWFTYNGPFTASADGLYILTYNSTDSVGNNETLQVARFKIDKIDPIPCSSFTSDIPVNHWTSYSTINIEWHGASDITSGVYGYSFEWSQSIDTLPDTVLDTTSNSVTTTLSSGIWYLHIRTRDAAGNWGFSAYHIGPFKIDTSPPSASVHLDGMYGMNNWFIDPVTVSIPTEDSFSGVDYILYSLDNGPWLTYSGPFTVSGDLSHRVYYKCVDYAGNWCDEDYREFVIDTTSPDTDAIVIGDTNPDGEYLNSAIVSFRIDDNLELYSHTEFRVNYGPWQMYNGPFTVSGAGYYLIHFYSVDYAGNVESEDYVDFDVIEIGYFYDDFETPSTGYDATVWTQEAWGTGSFWWDGDSISGLTASGHGHRTLVSNEFFQPDVKAKMNLRMTNYAGWEPAVCFGWTDMIAGGEGNVHGYWNYHFLGGQNGVWMELNWPQQDWFMLYSLKNGILSELRIYEDFTQFHDYELWWTSDEVILYIDGEIYGTLTNNVPTVPLEFKMTVTAWAGNTPDEWLYVDSVEIGEAQITPRAQIHAVGDDQGRVHLFQLNGLNNPVLLWTTKLTGTLVQRILLADVDQNGRNEVLAGTNAGWLYCLDGETGNTIWSYYTPWSGFYCWPDIFATNLDTDAQLEIVTAAYCKIGVGGGVIVLEHTGGVKALHNTPITYGHNGNGPDAISLGDFNDDDIQDVACLYGNVLYSGPQPRIQVVDFSSGTANVLIDFRYGGFTGSGMTNFDLGDLNSDGNLDFVTSGWWCPVAAFNDAGNLLWSVNAPGNADKVSKFVENRNGLGDNAVVIGTGAYSNTGGLYIYFVNPATGSILSSIPLGITASDFRPWAIANLDDDPAMEVIASSNTVYTTADRMTILDGGTMQVSWFATIEFTSQFFLPYDLNGDNQAEILAPNGRYISLFSGYGSRIWDYYLGAIPYVQSVAPLLIEVPPSPPTPFLAEGWSDDFNDGNFDGWSVTRGGYSAANYYLEGMTSTWNYIEHASTAVVGSWSFDYNFYGGPDGIWQGPDGDLGIWFIANDHWHSGDTTQLQSGYFIYFHPHVNAIELWMDPGDEGYNRVLLGSWSPPNFVKSWHVDITRDSNGVFNVYLDGVNRIQATDTTFYTSSFFGFLGYNLQEMDNVVVQDTGESTIDYDGTFTLSWKMETPSGTAIDYYQLQVSDNPDFTRLLGIWCPDYGLLSQDVTLLSPATYFFRIRAFDVNGFAGEWSNVQTMIVSRDTTIPLIDSPLDLIYEEASTGNTRVWNPTDFNPEHYQIYCDGYLVESGVWTGGPLVVAVDGLQQGNYSWTAVVFDTYDNWISDTLFVTVLENEAPEVGDVNTIYEAGTIGNTVTWYPYDFTPSRFEIWFGTTCIDSGDWDGSPISCFVDGLNPGVYSFDLTVFDATGLSAIAVAAITVVDTTNPVVTITPESTTVEEGSFGTEITWIATDLYPESYILWIDESPFASGPWVGGPVIITIDGLLLGTYNYTLTFIDESGNAASTFVWVYAEDTTPPSIDGPTEIVYEAGTTGNWIYWIASEPHPLEYMISLNGEPIILGLWGGNNLQRNIDGHDPGTYYYTLTCWDVFNNVGSHEVVVIVEDTTAPIVWGSDDLVYEAGVPGHSLTWSFTDLYPKYYVILRNGSLIDSDIWTGFDITISVDLLNPGLYNFSFVAYDLYGNYAVDLVWVNVEGNTPSGTDIEVPDLDTGVTLTFEETSTPGTTEVVITETGPTPPDNFRLMGVFYNITTTANFDGIIVVAIPYDEALVNGLEKNLKLWHWRESAGWEDCTILVDEANNIIYGEVTHLSLFGVMEDNASPITSYSLSGTEGLNGWYVSDVSLMLTATDTISEIGATYYSFDKIIWHLYSSCISITDAGLTSIFFYSIDVAHNVEETNQVDFKIDQSTPDTIATLTPVTPDGLSNWYINPVDVTLSFDDATSGVYQTFYRVNESPWILYITPVTFSVDGVYLLEFWSVDCAGNQESAESISFKIDQTSPTTTHSIGDPSFSTDPTYIKTITPISLEATDSLAGLTVTEYRLDMGVWIEYTSTFNILEIGFHTIDYRSWDTAGNLEDYHSFAVFVNAVELTYIGAIEGDYSDPVVLQAELIDIATQQPVSGKIIYFTLGSQSAEATTNELGIASVSPIIGQQAGVYTVNAVFYGDTQYTLSEHSTTFIIIKERAVPEYTGTTVVPTTANEITLRATVFDANDGYFGDVTKIQVTFRIYTAPIILSSPLLVVGPVYLEQSDVDGVGVITIDIGNLPENGYIIIISIDPEDNPFYMGPSSDLVTLTIFEPTGDFVTGGGWLMGPSGEKSNFGFNVKYSKRGTPRGQSIYIFHEGDWETIVKSNAWTGMAIDGDHSFFEGKCTVQNYNTETGELLWDEGNYQFRVDVWDNDESGGIDVYQIRVLDKDGLVFHEVGFYPLGLLGGGNIAIHLEKEE